MSHQRFIVFLNTLISSIPTGTGFLTHVVPPTQADVTLIQLQTLCGQYSLFFGVYVPRSYKEFCVYQVMQR